MTPILKTLLKKGFHTVSVLLLCCLIFVGCSGYGQKAIPIPALGAKATLRRADTAFEAGEVLRAGAAVRRTDDHSGQQLASYEKAKSLYLRVIESDPKSSIAKRAHYQVAKIYERFYAWDLAMEHYQNILDVAPTGDYVYEAENGMARIRTARAVILRKHIQSLNAGEQKGTKTAAAALYAIAGAYKDLQDYSHGNTHLTSRPKLPPDTPFVPRYLPEAERIMRSAEFQTHGMSRLNATKFIATFHSARYREPRLAFAQQALDENPNDFHTANVNRRRRQPMQRQSLKTPRIEIWRIFLLMILVFGGCSGCGQKTVPEVPVDPPEAVRQPESSDFQRRAAQLLREKRSADIELPAVPPDYYYGDILYWIPSVETRGCSCHDSPKKNDIFYGEV